MSFSAAILPEFDQEMANTRQVLECIPDALWDWKAQPSANTIGWNANHLADIPSWVEGTFAATEWDLAPPGGEPHQSPQLRSRDEALRLFDANVAAARRTLEQVTDEQTTVPWSLKYAGETLFTVPRAAVVRTWVLNHTIHHRAHLCVYLRLNDVKVPGMYGPTAS